MHAMAESGSKLLRLARRLLLRADVVLLAIAALTGAFLLSFYGRPAPNFSFLPAELPVAAESGEAEEVAEDGENLGRIPEAAGPIRFLMFNVQNYFVTGERSRSRYVIRPKSEAAREAVAEAIAGARPEIIGLAEIGGPAALEDLTTRLKKRGLDYPYKKALVRIGEDRALALLSRHPIVQDHSQANYGLYGRHGRKMLRGILDVTVKAEDGRYFRIIGAHLKSRAADDAQAASSLRSREAIALASYIQKAVRSRPEMPLLVFGDWNDGPADASLGIVRRGISKDASLKRVEAADPSGQTWTHYYEEREEYFAFDQIYVNKALRRRMGKDYACGIADSPAGKDASDHRAVWCDIR